MSNIVYNKFKEQLFRGNASLLSDTLKVALVDNTYTPDADHDTYSVSVASHEVTGTGYISGGKELTGKIITEEDVDDNAIFDAADTEWENSTISARYGVIYNVTLGGTDDLVAMIDFGSQKASSDGSFIIQWDNNGIFSLS